MASQAPVTNSIGLALNDYKGAVSTLCAGCGHDAVTGQIVRAFYQRGVDPRRVAKFSGIGCSSKTPAYFLNQAHGINSVHGRMPSVATGALLANRDLVGIGISGDGDTASIGMGQFVHMVRRNVPLIYIIENNGVYGLTKGQFSATADVGAVLKTGVVNDLPPVDLCSLAVELGASFVARSFSGDPKQLAALLEAAIAHRGTAVLDVISPCVTFNNHEGSTKSYTYAKQHEIPLHEIGFVPAYETIEADYEPGETKIVELHDGSKITLKKLDRDYDPSDRLAALNTLRQTRDEGLFLTGLFYVNPDQEDFTSMLKIHDKPLSRLQEDDLRPGPDVLSAIMQGLA
jgi:2-oxoglutarate ferredoxin oxidoreductase subunit beta